MYCMISDKMIDPGVAAPTTFSPMTASLQFLHKHFQGNRFGQKRSSSIINI